MRDTRLYENSGGKKQLRNMYYHKVNELFWALTHIRLSGCRMKKTGLGYTDAANVLLDAVSVKTTLDMEATAAEERRLRPEAHMR